MSSDELIREANSRLRSSRHEQDADEAPPVEPYQTPPEPPAGGTGPAPRSTQPTSSPSIEQQPEPQGPSYAWLRWVLPVLVFGGWFLFTTMDDASRDDTGEIVGAGDLDVMALQEGDCFNDPEELDDVVFDVAAIPCSEPHDNEVFSVQTLGPGLASGSFPGQQVLQDHSSDLCRGQVFDDYVGRPYLESDLDVFTMTPTADSWSQGDREIVCILYRLDLGTLTDTARGSGL